ncbi:MAG: hypothetical protein ABI230_07080 [Aestuariivirga sp.]
MATIKPINAFAMMVLQLIAEADISSGEKKQTDAEGKKYQIKHEWLL